MTNEHMTMMARLIICFALCVGAFVYFVHELREIGRMERELSRELREMEEQ